MERHFADSGSYLSDYVLIERCFKQTYPQKHIKAAEQTLNSGFVDNILASLVLLNCTGLQIQILRVATNKILMILFCILGFFFVNKDCKRWHVIITLTSWYGVCASTQCRLHIQQLQRTLALIWIAGLNFGPTTILLALFCTQPVVLAVKCATVLISYLLTLSVNHCWRGSTGYQLWKLTKTSIVAGYKIKTISWKMLRCYLLSWRDLVEKTLIAVC